MNSESSFAASRPGRIIARIEQFENAVLVWTILGLALIGFIQVFCRYLFNYSFTWYEELGRYLGVFLTFLGAAIGVRKGSHFTMDLLVSHLPRPWQQLLRFCTCCLSGSFCLLVVFYTWKVAARLHRYGTTSPSMEIPLYLVYLPILFFSLVMGLRFFGVGIKEILSLRTGKGDGADIS